MIFREIELLTPDYCLNFGRLGLITKSYLFSLRLILRMNCAVSVDVPTGAVSFPMEIHVDVNSSHGRGVSMPSQSSEVRYQYQLKDKETRVSTMKVVERPCKLRKALDDGTSALSDAVRRQTVELTTTEYEYDLRALFYAAGDLCSRTIAGVQWDHDVATVEGVAPNATRVGPRSLVLMPNGDSPRIATYMFALLARMCGVTEVFVGAEQYQMARAPENDVEKRRYLHVIMQYLQPDVIQQGVYGEHMFPHFRGCNRYITLRAHSTEGGYIRDALINATYPKPRGLISTSRHAVGEFPRFFTRSTNAQAFCRDVLSHMLECSAMVADADPAGVHNLTTVMTNTCYDDYGTLLEGVENNDQQRPSAYPDLCDVMDIIENHSAMMLTRTDIGGATEGHSSMLARNTFRKYFEEDSVDTHLGRAEMMPYAFVEHGVVLKHPSTVACDGPKAGREVELPLLPGGVLVPARYSKHVSASGRHIAPKVYSRFRDYGIRQMGAFYLGSGPFGSDDFTRMRLVPNANAPPEPILCNDNLTTMATMHWMRPHCPVPVPGECSLWHGRAMLEIQTNRSSTLRTGWKEPVIITVSEPVAHYVEKLEVGKTKIRRNVDAAYRTVLNINELSDDEEVQRELFEQLDDHLPPRLARGREGFVGLADDRGDVMVDTESSADIGAQRAPEPRRAALETRGPATPEEPGDADEGAGES